MALAVNRTGVIFKKCDMSNHRPETVKQCVVAPVSIRARQTRSELQARLDAALLGQRQAA